MKIILLTAAASLSLSLAVNAGDTFPKLTTLDGETITNAEITSHTATYAIVVWDGGGKKIPFTNLPPEIQQKYHFDPVAAAAATAAQAKKQGELNKKTAEQAAQIAKAKATLGPAQRIHILKVISDSCVQFTGQNGMLSTGYVHNMPFEVLQFVRDLNRTQADADAMRNVDQNATYTRTVGVGRGAFQGATRVQTDDAAAAGATRQHLGELLAKERLGASTITAAPTGFLLNGNLRQWEFRGQGAALLSP